MLTFTNSSKPSADMNKLQLQAHASALALVQSYVAALQMHTPECLHGC
jgi:hypothetical protein